MLYVDLLRWDDIEKEVFSDHLHVDYTSLLGGEVVDVTSKEQVEFWKGIMRRLEKSQHITTYGFTPTFFPTIVHRDTVHSLLISPNPVPSQVRKMYRSLLMSLLPSSQKTARKDLYRMG